MPTFLEGHPKVNHADPRILQHRRGCDVRRPEEVTQPAGESIYMHIESSLHLMTLLWAGAFIPTRCILCDFQLLSTPRVSVQQCGKLEATLADPFASCFATSTRQAVVTAPLQLGW